ncbi:MAG: purine-nucleoside phosphorylase [Candidatus Kapabacteria bacterium]|nr:purine-nucleoside phosphorylase [Candidatus Kapabacteria bacterium]
MTQLLHEINESLDVISRHTSARPDVAIILGTGLGGLAEAMDVSTAIDYAEIPHFPVSTVESHSGRLLLGSLADRSVVVMQGRFHLYEGYTPQQITFPVRVLHALGARTLVVSNACGGLHPLYRRSDIMVIDDHINLLGDNPLIGPNEPSLGPRFPDMSEPYSRRLQQLALDAAISLGFQLHRGVYVAVAGPNLETRAEYRFLRTIGADVVGMSTVPENIVARHMGMDVLGLSIITDECHPDNLAPVRLEDVLEAAAIAEPRLTKIIQAVLPSL